MRKHKQQLSTDALLKTKTRDIELTEKELGQVTGGDKIGAPVITCIESKTGSGGTYPGGKYGSPDIFPIQTKA